jgi:hypothetical protein
VFDAVFLLLFSPCWRDVLLQFLVDKEGNVVGR